MDTTKLQPFDLERAKAGHPICSMLGEKLIFIGTDCDGIPVVQWPNTKGIKSFVREYLRMLPRKVTKWHLLFADRGHTTKESAQKVVDEWLSRGRQAKVIEHEWDES